LAIFADTENRALKKLISIHFLLLLTQLIFGQNGQPFLTNIDVQGIPLESRTYSMVQDENEVILIAKRQGIFTYDGANWGKVDVPGIPQKLMLLEDADVVLVALTGEFGKLEQGSTGEYTYTRLIDSTQMGADFTNIMIGKEAVFFYSTEAVYKTDLKLSESPIKLKDVPDAVYDGAFVLGSRFFIKKAGGSLDVLYRDSVIALPTRPFGLNEQLLFSIEPESGNTIICTANERLITFNGKRFMELNPDDHAYLDEHLMTTGIELEGNRYVIGTMSGGCIVVDSKTGKTLFTLNYRTGLPDNEVMAMCRDRNGGLWIAHELGITRVDLEIPINDFSAYPGIEGNLLTGIWHRNRLYVGTNNGVYYLSETKNRDEFLKMVEQQEAAKRVVVNNPVRKATPQKPKINQASTSARAKAIDETSSTEILIPEHLTEKEKRQLRRRLKKEKRQKLKNEAENVNSVEEPSSQAVIDSIVVKPKNEDSVIPKEVAIPTISAKQTRMEQASSFVYKRVEGLEVKSKQFVAYQNKLLVATNTGVYEVSGNRAVPIVSDVYVNHISESTAKNKFYVCTSSGYQTIRHVGDRWLVTEAADSLNANIYSIAEDGVMGLWMGSDNIAWYLDLDENGEEIGRTEYVFGPDQSEPVQIASISGVPHFLLPSGIYTYSESDDRMLPTTESRLFLSGNGKYLTNGADNNWFFNGSNWNSLETSDAGNTRFLELFDDLRDIHRDAKGNLWVVDGSQHLIRVDVKADSSISEVFNVYIRQMTDGTGAIFSLEEALTVHKKNSLEFLISAPFYLKSDGTDYQYRLVGLKDSWSRWNPSASIEIPFIPAGVYTLEIRARNILGQVSDISSLSFQIEETIWKRWYMVMLYALVLILIIFGVIKLRERTLREQQRELESMVKERTVELEEEKGKVEGLLLNILPKETAEELQANGKATAKHYNLASVLFTDFKGFTKFAEQTTPEDLVAELDHCFIQFDDITSSMGLEKIKTIGDAYMCAGGVPIKNKSNPISTTVCALRLRNVMRSIAIEKKKRGEKFWEIRIGVHSGPLTAGVVGKKKFAYDVWGDTVNTASRMESSSEPGKVNVSGATYELVKEYFDCEYRGKIDAKGKGLIDMYFIKGIVESYSENGDGITPNKELEMIMTL
jgi:class 3 adenylate cyclase